MAIPDELLAAKQVAADLFLTAKREVTEFAAFAASAVPRQNVVGVGIGRKVVRGREKSAQVLRLYVERKIGKEAIPDEFLLPKEIKGVETDVIEAGRFRALAVGKPKSRPPARGRSAAARRAGGNRGGRAAGASATLAAAAAAVPVFRRRLRPAQPGGSCGFQFSGNKAGFVMAGTFGALVEDADGNRYVLSNNHVLADENGLAPGSPIFQPGLLDGGDPAADQIATLTRFVQLRTGQANTVDAAIARLDDAALARARFLPKVNQLKGTAPVDAAERMRVHKVGRTTGYTTGEVFDVSADISVRYDLGLLRFNDQILIRGDAGVPFSAGGDSGSLIVDRKTGRPTGLLFAGSDKFTIANHVADVLAQLAVAVVR